MRLNARNSGFNEHVWLSAAEGHTLSKICAHFSVFRCVCVLERALSLTSKGKSFVHKAHNVINIASVAYKNSKKEVGANVSEFCE